MEDILEFMDIMDKVGEKKKTLGINEASFIDLAKSLNAIAFVPEKRNHKSEKWGAPYKYHK